MADIPLPSWLCPLVLITQRLADSNSHGYKGAYPSHVYDFPMPAKAHRPKYRSRAIELDQRPRGVRSASADAHWQRWYEETSVLVRAMQYRNIERYAARDDEGRILATKTGKVVSNWELERWVAEAERGYNPAKLKARAGVRQPHD